MGEVYKATDTNLQRNIALKILPLEFTSDPDRKRRFLKEARNASLINHPHIVTIYEIGSGDNIDYIAMEYVEGCTLQELASKNLLQLDKALDYGIQIAEALAKAHSNGIIHRDLKPQNIMVNENSGVKVLDFGLAKLIEPKNPNQELSRVSTVSGLTQPGQIVGTVPYMSPEQIEGKDIDFRSDIFSFGSVFYEMLTGRRAFQGDSSAAVLSAILRDYPPLASNVRKDLHPEIVRIVQKMMEKDREFRYQHTEDLVTDLKTLKRNLSTDPKTPTSDSRRKFILATSLVFMLLLSIFAIFYMYKQRKEPSFLEAKLKLISNFPGAHSAASFSPDGKKMAFLNDASGTTQVWIKDLTKGEATQLTSMSQAIGRPFWSPNNDQITFHTSEGIWSVKLNADKTPRKIIEGGYNAAFSHNGKLLVFERNDQIWIANTDGSNQKQVEGVPVVLNYIIARYPTFSPDGTKIAYFQSKSNDPHGDIWIVSIDKKSAKQLTFDSALGGTPVWSPDGKFIIFSSSRGESRTIWRVPVLGGAAEPVTTGTGEDTFPEISHDGKTLIFTNTRNTYVMKLLDTAAGSSRNLLEAVVMKFVYPHFSPNGKLLSFFREGSGGDLQIFVLELESGKVKQITETNGEQNIFPHWSKDGKYLYYFQNRPTISYRRISVNDGHSLAIVPGWLFGKIRWPEVDPSQKYVAYVSTGNKGHMTSIRNLQNGSERVFKNPMNYPTWSKDGTLLLGESNGLIVVCTVNDSRCKDITEGEYPIWGKNEQSIYFLRQGEFTDGNELWKISIDGTGEVKIADLRPMLDIDPFYDVSTQDQVAWVEFQAAKNQLWMLKLM